MWARAALSLRPAVEPVHSVNLLRVYSEANLALFNGASQPHLADSFAFFSVSLPKLTGERWRAQKEVEKKERCVALEGNLGSGPRQPHTRGWSGAGSPTLDPEWLT